MEKPTEFNENQTPGIESAAQAISQHNRELNALFEATSALLSTLNLESLLGKILNAASKAIPRAEQGFLYLIAPDTGKLEMRAVLDHFESDPRIQRVSKSIKHEYIPQVVEQRQPMLVSLAEHGADFKTAIAAPLILENQVLGALTLETSAHSAFGQKEVRLLATFAAMATAAIRNAQLHAEVQQLAITDPLTGLYNRRGLVELGSHEIERSQRFARPLAAMMIDVDNLKDINDQYGHSTGDQALCIVAQAARQLTRKVDIVARISGDEFVILLPEINLFEASQVAERLRSEISCQKIQINKETISITASFGITRWLNNTHLDDLIKQTDRALYAAKQAGKNQVVIQ